MEKFMNSIAPTNELHPQIIYIISADHEFHENYEVHELF